MDKLTDREKLCLAAFAYEVLAESVISDAEFDRLALKVAESRYEVLGYYDEFFASDEFDPSTGMWIWGAPFKLDMEQLYDTLYEQQELW